MPRRLNTSSANGEGDVVRRQIYWILFVGFRRRHCYWRRCWRRSLSQPCSPLLVPLPAAVAVRVRVPFSSSMRGALTLRAVSWSSRLRGHIRQRGGGESRRRAGGLCALPLRPLSYRFAWLRYTFDLIRVGPGLCRCLPWTDITSPALPLLLRRSARPKRVREKERVASGQSKSGL